MKVFYSVILTGFTAFSMATLALASESPRTRDVRHEVVMTNFKILGSRDTMNEIRVSADIHAGASICFDGEVTAKIKSEIVDRDLVIFPVLTVPLNQSNKICPKFYAPVVKHVSAIIRVKATTYDVAMVRNANEINSFLPLSLFASEDKPSLASVIDSAAIMQNVKTRPINGGINPSYSGIELSATVYLGSNSCLARGKNVVLRTTNIDGVSYVYAHFFSTLKTIPESRVICTMQYEPVFESRSIALHMLTSQLDQTNVLNVEAKGAVKIISDLN